MNKKHVLYLIFGILIAFCLASTSSKTISQLTELTDLDSDDFLIVEDSSSSATRKLRAVRFIGYTASQGFDSLSIDSIITDTVYVGREIAFVTDSSKINNIEVRNLFDVTTDDTISAYINFSDTNNFSKGFYVYDTLFTETAKTLNKVSLLSSIEETHHISTAESGYGITGRGAWSIDDTLAVTDAGGVGIDTSIDTINIWLPPLSDCNNGLEYGFYVTDATNYANIIADTSNAGFSLMTASATQVVGDTITLDSDGSTVFIKASGASLRADNLGFWIVTGGYKANIH